MPQVSALSNGPQGGVQGQTTNLLVLDLDLFRNKLFLRMLVSHEPCSTEGTLAEYPDPLVLIQGHADNGGVRETSLHFTQNDEGCKSQISLIWVHGFATTRINLQDRLVRGLD